MSKHVAPSTHVSLAPSSSHIWKHQNSIKLAIPECPQCLAFHGCRCASITAVKTINMYLRIPPMFPHGFTRFLFFSSQPVLETSLPTDPQHRWPALGVSPAIWTAVTSREMSQNLEDPVFRISGTLWSHNCPFFLILNTTFRKTTTSKLKNNTNGNWPF